MNEWQSQRELANWLQNYSINTGVFETSSTELLRAQITAKGTLDYYSHLITQEQSQLLKAYCKDFANPSSRKYLTAYQTHQVLNIGNKVRRKIFKQCKSFN